jgi:hypothetical protein
MVPRVLVPRACTPRVVGAPTASTRDPGLSVRLANTTLVATGTHPRSGTLAVTLDSTTLVATGTGPASATLAVTLAATTLDADATTPAPPGVTATFTLQPSSLDDRETAWRQGTRLHTSWGEYLRIPTDADPDVGDYVYFTHDGAGVDPGDHVAELAGYTGHAVDLTGDSVSASTRAAAARAQVTISGYTIGGSGATFSVTGDIGTCTVGGMHDATLAGAAGARSRTPVFATNPLSGRIGQSMTWSAGTVVPTALGIYLADTTTALRLAIYRGGTAGAGGHTSAALLGEVLIPAGGPVGYNFASLPPSAVVSIANGDVIRFVAKSNGSSIPAYRGLGDGFTDYANNLEIYSETASDPTVAFPADLSGESATNAFAIYVMGAIQYRSADGTSAVFTTRWGLHIDDPTDLAQSSSLTSPDAGGAELYMGASPPPLLGMELDTWAIGWSAAHGAQMRMLVAQGGSIGDAETADILYQAQTTGSTTNAWAEYSVPGNVAVDPTEPLHWGVKNNSVSVNFRFALNANRDTADPEDLPTDFSDASEYEIFNSTSGTGSGSGAYDTNPANATASPVDPLTAATASNTNYPAAYLRLRVPASTVA